MWRYYYTSVCTWSYGTRLNIQLYVEHYIIELNPFEHNVYGTKCAGNIIFLFAKKPDCSEWIISFHDDGHNNRLMLHQLYNNIDKIMIKLYNYWTNDVYFSVLQGEKLTPEEMTGRELSNIFTVLSYI